MRRSSTPIKYKLVTRIVSCVRRWSEERRRRRRRCRKLLCLLVFLTLSSTRPQQPGDTRFNPQSKLAPCCGNLIQFPLFQEGQTQATRSLLIACRAIKSHRGLSFARQVTTCCLTLPMERGRKDLSESERVRSWLVTERPNIYFPR